MQLGMRIHPFVLLFSAQPMAYELVGCYLDNINARDMTGALVSDTTHMTQLYCFNYCQQLVRDFHYSNGRRCDFICLRHYFIFWLTKFLGNLII